MYYKALYQDGDLNETAKRQYRRSARISKSNGYSLQKNQDSR